MQRYLASARSLRFARSATRSLASVATAPAPTSDNEMPGQVKTTQQWEEFGKTHVAHGLGRLKNQVMLKGEGLKITAADGKEYLDFTAGIGVTNLGQ
jgi:4-aminobutyrate aminotransferase